MIHTAILLKTSPNTRAGTLTIPVWGTFEVEVWLTGPETAHLRVTQNGTLWQGTLTLCHEEAEDITIGDAFWNGYVSVGVEQGWTYRLSGKKRGNELHLEFDDDTKQPFRGEYGKVDENGRVVV